MNEYNDYELDELIESAEELDFNDDDNPASYFTIPAPPVLGQTSWSIN